MNTVLLVCVILITIAVIAFVVEAIITFHDIRRAARDIENLTENISEKVNSIDTISEAAKIVVSGAAKKWLSFIEGVSRFLGKKKPENKNSGDSGKQ